MRAPLWKEAVGQKAGTDPGRAQDSRWGLGAEAAVQQAGSRPAARRVKGAEGDGGDGG